MWAGQEAKISQFNQDLEIIFLIKLFALQQHVECSSLTNTETRPPSPNLAAWGAAKGMTSQIPEIPTAGWGTEPKPPESLTQKAATVPSKATVPCRWGEQQSCGAGPKSSQIFPSPCPLSAAHAQPAQAEILVFQITGYLLLQF